MKSSTSHLRRAIVLLAVFLLWTVAVCTIDVRPIGPLDSAVGFAALNQWAHTRTGVHLQLYLLTDWLSLIPLVLILCFACLGLAQWLRRKRLRKVDGDILLLGGFYLLVMTLFLLFEALAINYRPILLDGVLEASYPSSTTMLVLCVMPTACLQLRAREKQAKLRRRGTGLMMAFTAFMVIARLLSGVHWLTDIVGGALLSGGLVSLYQAACARLRK